MDDFSVIYQTNEASYMHCLFITTKEYISCKFLARYFYFATLFEQLDALCSIIKIGAQMTEKAFFKAHQNAPEFMVCLGLKVSYFRNVFLVSSILPKKRTKNST